MIHQLEDIAYLTIDGYSRREFPQVANYAWWRQLITPTGKKSEFFAIGRMGWQTVTIPGQWLRKVMDQLGENAKVIYGIGDHHQPFATHVITLSNQGIEETRRLRGTTFHLDQIGDAQ